MSTPNMQLLRYNPKSDLNTLQCSSSLCTALIPHVHIPLLLLLLSFTASESCLFNRRFDSLSLPQHEVSGEIRIGRRYFVSPRS